MREIREKPDKIPQKNIMLPERGAIMPIRSGDDLKDGKTSQQG